mmetsp:Transcript_22123/g.30977  ORF Transcript_22123/g.30977 Transcript_22123/m.30977 type:complete len:210 (-) Transcript_22123:558-1187(-)
MDTIEDENVIERVKLLHNKFKTHLRSHSPHHGCCIVYLFSSKSHNLLANSRLHLGLNVVLLEHSGHDLCEGLGVVSYILLLSGPRVPALLRAKPLSSPHAEVPVDVFRLKRGGAVLLFIPLLRLLPFREDFIEFISIGLLGVISCFDLLTSHYSHGPYVLGDAVDIVRRNAAFLLADRFQRRIDMLLDFVQVLPLPGAKHLLQLHVHLW